MLRRAPLWHELATGFVLARCWARSPDGSDERDTANVLTEALAGQPRARRVIEAVAITVHGWGDVSDDDHRPDRSLRRPPHRSMPTLWPDVAAVPHSPVRSAIATRIFHRAAALMPLRVVEPGGRSYGGGTAGAPGHAPRPPATRSSPGSAPPARSASARPTWPATGPPTTSPACSSAFAANMRDLVPAMLHRLRHAVLSRMPQSHDNTIEGARENIHHHYDLSNDAVQDVPRRVDDLLVRGVQRRAVRLGRGPRRRAAPQDRPAARHRRRSAPTRGCSRSAPGWGELAIRAARRGAHVTSLTISTEQAELARERVAAAGLADRVDVAAAGLPRGARARYDAVVSVEMIEAVGANHWDDVLPHDRPRARARRPGRAAGDPAGRLHGARDPRHVHVDPQVHLPRRPARVRRGDRPHDQGPHRAAHRGPVQLRPALRRDAAALARALRGAVARRSPRSASTRRSAGCGRCTSPTPRRASAPATSTSRSSP